MRVLFLFAVLSFAASCGRIGYDVETEGAGAQDAGALPISTAPDGAVPGTFPGPGPAPHFGSGTGHPSGAHLLPQGGHPPGSSY